METMTTRERVPPMTYTVHEASPYFLKELKFLFPNRTQEELQALKLIITFQGTLN